MPVTESSILTVLRERASLRPNYTAFTFLDYEQDWLGVTESLTWSQLYRRVLNVAGELSACGSVGDRAVILAPQGLDYIAAFLGALQAGLIAVPLSVPTGGVADDRVSSVLRDASPSVILTTSRSSAMSASMRSRSPANPPRRSSKSICSIRIRQRFDRRGRSSERRIFAVHLRVDAEPAGVMISYENLRANIRGRCPVTSAQYGGSPTGPHRRVVAAVLPRHGLIVGICTPVFGMYCAVLTSPASFLQRPARWMQLLACNPERSTGAPNFAFDRRHEKQRTTTWPGCDLGDVLTSSTAAERVQPATLKRFTERFARFNLRGHVIRPAYGLAERPVYVATPTTGRNRQNRPLRIRQPVRGQRHAVRQRKRHAAGQLRHAGVTAGADRRSATPGSSVRPKRSGRSGCTAPTWRWAIGRTSN